MPTEPSPPPKWTHCKHQNDPRSDIVYPGTGGMGGLTAAYCGWCGAIFSVGTWTAVLGKK